MVGQRLRNALDREPVWRRLEGKIDTPAHNIRNKPGEFLRENLPQFPNRNFGGGIAVGTVEAGIALILERTLGIPFGSDTEIVDVRSANNGAIYVVNVDAPFENMAAARAFLEANTGFTSYLTDLWNVQNISVLKTRSVRDTYQIELLVED